MKLKSQAGLTLVELLISMAIGTFIMMATLSILTDFLRTQQNSQNFSTLLTTSENIFNEMTLEIHSSQEAIITFDGIRLIKTDATSAVEYILSGTDLLRREIELTTNTTLSEIPLNPPTARVINFSIVDLIPTGTTTVGSTIPQPSLLKINLTLELDSRRAPGVDLERTTTISLRTGRSPNATP